MVQILDLLEIAPPFELNIVPTPTPIIYYDTDVLDELILETPTFKISGNKVNIKTGRISREDNLTVRSSISNSLNSKVFNNTQVLTFKGDVVINFDSRYPIKTYNSIMTNEDLIVGEPGYNYQYERAEIKYSIKGGSPRAKGDYRQTYSKPIVIKENTSGSDNVLVRFKVFYKGKKSEEGLVELRIIKEGKGFYGL